MADDLITRYSTSDVDTQGMGQVVESLIQKAKDSRRTFERRWYDNNFFDDGFHFRFLSRTQNKIVDLSERANIYNPMRAIPKASRQIRGMANLLTGKNPTPTVYPEKVDVSQFPPSQDQTGQMVVNPEYQKAMEASNDYAKKAGHYLEEEFENQDLQEKLALMTILTAKHGVSFMQVWPDYDKEEIKTQVFDAFDVYLLGSLTELEDQPFVIKTSRQLISQIKANDNFDPDQLTKISPDNRHANSEIKEAYMRARYGGESNPDQSASLILKEAFCKEYINPQVRARINKQSNGSEILKDRKDGDCIIRQTFVAGSVWLRDRYLDMDTYPLVEFRFEPGPLYQVPLIERFIPANKSLDLVSSRVERYTHTMVTGSWSKRQGEQFSIDNSAGGQIVEYSSTPPTQNAIAPIPGFVFQFMQFLGTVIEEQGVSTTTLGKLPTGVRANAAIESLKESEYANLHIASNQLNKTIKKISEKMLDIADSALITPKTVYYMEKGKPAYFDVIGNSALEGRKKLKVNTQQGVVPLKRDTIVDIEVESGLAYTKEGQKTTMLQLIQQVLIPFSQAGYLSPESVKVAIEKTLEVYQFGATSEFMEALENYQGGITTDQQKQELKQTIVEVMDELQKSGMFPTPEQRIQEGMVATAQVVKDAGMGTPQKPETPQKQPSVSINFKDLPPEGKQQAAAEAGISLDPNQIRMDEANQQMMDQQSKVQLQQAKGGNNGNSQSKTTGG